MPAERCSGCGREDILTRRNRVLWSTFNCFGVQAGMHHHVKQYLFGDFRKMLRAHTLWPAAHCLNAISQPATRARGGEACVVLILLLR